MVDRPHLRIHTLIILWLAALLAVTPATAQQESITETGTWVAAGLSFDYPADWVTRDDTQRYGAMSIATTQAALDAVPLPPGELNVLIYPPLSKQPESLSRVGLRAMTAQSALLVLSIPESEAPVTLDLDGREAARRDLQTDDLQVMLLTIDLGDVVVPVFATAPRADFAQYEAAVLDLVASIRPAELAFPGGTVIPVDAEASTVEDDTGIDWQYTAPLEDADFTTLTGAFGRLDVAGERVYIATGADSILVFEADGTFVQIIRNESINIHDVAVADDGTLWVIDPLQMKVFQLDADGRVLNWFGQYGTGVEQFDLFSPLDLVIGPEGRLYVLNTTQVGGQTYEDIQIWTPDGTFVTSFNATFRAGGLRDASMLAVAPGLDLFFTNGGNLLTTIFSFDGTVLDRLPAPVSPYIPGGFTVDENSVFYFEDNGQITRFSLSLDVFGTALDDETAAFQPGEFFYPRGLGILPGGDLIVADANETHFQVTRVDSVR
jgi:hypothetical protein